MESWVEGADGSGFGLENLPFGAVSPAAAPPGPPSGSASTRSSSSRSPRPACSATCPPACSPARCSTRSWRSAARPGAPPARGSTELLRAARRARGGRRRRSFRWRGRARLPLAIGDYVDFDSSIEHASNVGRIFRPDAEPLLPQSGATCRSATTAGPSSVIVSGTPCAARGQLPPPRLEARPASARPSELDIELELGFVTGPATRSARRSPRRLARAHLRLRARQRLERARRAALEYRPARPVPRQVVRDLDLAVDRAAGGARAASASRRASRTREPLPYLAPTSDWALDVELEVALAPDGGEETVVSRTNARGPTGPRRSSSPTRPSTAPTCARRPLRLGHDLGRPPRQPRQPARAHLGRPRPARARRRRAARLPAGRRHRDPARRRR